MRTAVDLTDQEISELRELTQEKDSSSALRVAVLEYIRYTKRMRLKEVSGKSKCKIFGGN